MTASPYSKRWLWFLLLAFCAVWLYALGARTLVPTDEGRYAEMAREMFASGDWITPRLNGIKYFEKPPLQIWMTAAAFSAFGLGEWQARLWTGLCGLLGVALAGYAGMRVFNPRIGLSAALVLGSSFWWAGFGHVNSLDMGLAGMMTLTLCGLLVGQCKSATPRERRNWMLACWAGMALAVLSKGLIGIVLPGAVLVLYTLWSRDWAIWKRLHFGAGLALFAAIAVPWFVLASIRNPEFARFFFIHEHWERFTSKVHHRAGPWYYFIPLLVVGIFPWMGLLPRSLRTLPDREAPGFQPEKILLVWAVFIFVFFSVSGSKLPSYILPIFPALALLIAIHLESASRLSLGVTTGLTAAVGIAGLALVPFLPRLAPDPLEAAAYQAAQPWTAAGSLVILAGAGTALRAIRARSSQLALQVAMALAVSGFLAGQLYMLGTEQAGRYRAGLQLVPPIQAELTPDMKLYSVGLYDQTLPFYLRRTVTLVEHADELEFGLTQEPARWLPTRDAFIREWTAGPKALAITRPEIFDDLRKRGIPMRIVAQDSRRVVIANSPITKAQQ